MHFSSIWRKVHFVISVFTVLSVSADPALDKLLSEGKFREAIDYTDEKYPLCKRTVRLGDLYHYDKDRKQSNRPYWETDSP